MTEIKKEKKIPEAKIQKFVEAIINGLDQSAAFRIAYPASLKWKPESVHSHASTMAANSKVKARLDELNAGIIKELIKEFAVPKSHTAKVMAKITINPDSKDSDKIAACKAINEMYGYNSPAKSKVDLTSSDGSMAPKSVIDFTKVSDAAMKELLNARIEK
jgi:hypothetical protein